MLAFALLLGSLVADVGAGALSVTNPKHERWKMDLLDRIEELCGGMNYSLEEAKKAPAKIGAISKIPTAMGLVVAKKTKAGWVVQKGEHKGGLLKFHGFGKGAPTIEKKASAPAPAGKKASAKGKSKAPAPAAKKARSEKQLAADKALGERGRARKGQGGKRMATDDEIAGAKGAAAGALASTPSGKKNPFAGVLAKLSPEQRAAAEKKYGGKKEPEADLPPVQPRKAEPAPAPRQQFKSLKDIQAHQKAKKQQADDEYAGQSSFSRAGGYDEGTVYDLINRLQESKRKRKKCRRGR